MLCQQLQKKKEQKDRFGPRMENNVNILRQLSGVNHGDGYPDLRQSIGELSPDGPKRSDSFFS